MTGAAELLGQLIGPHITGIEDTLVLKLPCLHRRYVIDSLAMAGFTSHSGNQPIQFQLITEGGPGPMTAKTMARLVHTDRAARRLVERPRHIARIPNREIKGSGFPVETQVAFIERSVVSKEISLTGFPLAECVEDGLGDCVFAVTNCVEALVATADNFVGVGSRAKREPRMSAEYFAGCHRFEGPAHCRCALVHRFFLMTLNACLRAGVFRVPVFRTPGRGHRRLTG